jgi:hypothetical protein
MFIAVKLASRSLDALCIAQTALSVSLMIADMAKVAAHAADLLRELYLPLGELDMQKSQSRQSLPTVRLYPYMFRAQAQPWACGFCMANEKCSLRVSTCFYHRAGWGEAISCSTL